MNPMRVATVKLVLPIRNRLRQSIQGHTLIPPTLLYSHYLLGILSSTLRLDENNSRFSEGMDV